MLSYRTNKQKVISSVLDTAEGCIAINQKSDSAQPDYYYATSILSYGDKQKSHQLTVQWPAASITGLDCSAANATLVVVQNSHKQKTTNLLMWPVPYIIYYPVRSHTICRQLSTHASPPAAPNVAYSNDIESLCGSSVIKPARLHVASAEFVICRPSIGVEPTHHDAPHLTDMGNVRRPAPVAVTARFIMILVLVSVYLAE